MPADKVTWDADMDRRLFLAILGTQDVAVNSAAVAATLTADGFPLTANAINKRLKRIRSMAAEGKSPSPSPTKTGGNKRGKASSHLNDGEESPTKSSKTIRNYREAEEEEEGGDDDEGYGEKEVKKEI